METFEQDKLQELQEKAIQESAWVQFYSLQVLDGRWIGSLEKTDIYIEKSVKLSFDLMNIAPINSLLTLENLFFKEKTTKN
jgi:hypothetical protein